MRTAIALLALFSLPALAQEPKAPSAEEVAAVLSAVIEQRNEAQNRLATLTAELRRVQADAQKSCKAKEAK